MVGPPAIRVGERTYERAIDITTEYRALVAIRVRDAVTGQPVYRARLSVDRPGVRTGTVADGLVSVAGYPELSFPDPTATYPVSLTVGAPGYVSATWPENVPGGGPFPVVLPAVELNPLPVELGGLVVQSRSNRTAVPGATVKVDHPTLSVVALRTPLRLPHGRNTVVRGMTVVLAGPVLKLTADVRAGSATIALDDPNAVAAGDVLCLDWRQRLELARVLTPEPARGEAVLEAPLGRSYSAWTEMKLATLTPTGPTAHLDRASAPAAGLLRLDGPVGGEALRVGAPAAAALERAITGAIADAQGYWALAGVAGVREVRLKPVAPGPPPPPPPAAPRVTWTLDYGQPVNVVNLQLAP